VLATNPVVDIVQMAVHIGGADMVVPGVIFQHPVRLRAGG
jgi:hypothetical protein